MPFCANCGSQVEGRFCAKCGAPAGAGAPQATAPVVNAAPVSQAAPMADNLAAALCYALGLITGVLFLVLEPYNRNRNIRFHAFQSIFVSVAWILFRIVLGILLTAMWSVGGFFFMSSISLLITLAGVILWLYLLLSAYQGKKVVLPIVGPLAEKQA